jgi:spore coat protein U-like protein
VILPANLNFTATQNLAFDAYFGCDIQGGTANGVEQTGSISNAVAFPITVPSALRASYAGTDLAFGEIGNETGPGKVTANSNYIRVQSTSPYKVGLSSERDFYMTVGGTAPANATQKVGYNLKFLGLTRTAGTTGLNAISNKQCNRPGVGDSFEDKLYIQAQLNEGGAGKAPSGNYFDTLTVSIEPLNIGTGDPGFVCGGTGNGLF